MGTRIAILDPGSFVLPYDFQLVQALAARGDAVTFYGSTTRYNGELLEAMRQLPGVRVVAKAISSSVATRWRAALAFVGLLAHLWFEAVLRRRFDLVNLQFGSFRWAEWAVCALLRRRLVYTVHNAVPHRFTGVQHGPTRRLARLAMRLVFLSEATRDDFMARYGEAFRAKSVLLPHGLVPAAPDLAATPYAPQRTEQALVFWSRVQPYKGVELFADLAASPALRARGLSLAVHGIWSPELLPLQRTLREQGVAVHDHYLDTAALLALLRENAVFVLPYQHASQSGALYTLLNHGRVFLCTDVGDLGAFMRRFGLQGLLLKSRSAEAVIDCLDHLDAHRDEVIAAFQRAQQSLGWQQLLADAPEAYAAPRG